MSLNSLDDFSLAEFVENLRESDHSKNLSQSKPPWYNFADNTLCHSITDEETVCEWVDQHFAVLRSARSNKIVGFQIYGITKIAKDIQTEVRANATR